uniref:Uncharacterized protein n=1 Tax=Arundo donax TaxID=35708 RepID=A0A0A9AZ67_ARUDO
MAFVNMGSYASAVSSRATYYRFQLDAIFVRY